MSSARAIPTAAIKNTATASSHLMSATHLILDGLDDVAQIAGRIPEGLGALRLADAIERTYHHARVASARRPGCGPVAERIRSEIAAELCASPRLPAVVRDLHLAEAVAAVEGDALERGGSTGGDARARLGRDEEGPHGHALDRDGRLRYGPRFDTSTRVVRNPIGRLHPELLERLVDDGDLREILYPVRRIPARDDEPCRKSVEHRQRSAVHLVRDDDVRIVQHAADRKRLDEIGHARKRGLVEPVECDVDGALPDT